LDLADRETRHWEVPVARALPRSGRQPGRGYPERRTVPAAVVTPAAEEASDESLLARLSRGDTAAGETLVERHYAPLMRYLQRTAGPRAAEDLLQQTWLSVLTHADRFVADAGGGSFKGWLFRIATNKTKDHWRAAGREKAAKDGYARATEGAAPWAGHAADGAEQCEKLRRAIEQLPQGQREVLLLRYYGNMKFSDIADVLGCPVNTALTRAHKGLLKLRDAMAPEARTRRDAAVR
jgi:RNA polymerase sigma-70 factor (ECF subfamily)